MKKYIPYLLIILFPYMIVFALICIFTGLFMDTIFHNNIYSILILLIIIYVGSLGCTVIMFIKGFSKDKRLFEIMKSNMIIKLIHIPAYLLIFAFGLICSLTIFTIGITIALVILDIMTIILSGLIGVGGILRGLREHKLSIRNALLHSILQFVFCADIISSIILYRKIKATEEVKYK